MLTSEEYTYPGNSSHTSLIAISVFEHRGLTVVSEPWARMSWAIRTVGSEHPGAWLQIEMQFNRLPDPHQWAEILLLARNTFLMKPWCLWTHLYSWALAPHTVSSRSMRGGRDITREADRTSLVYGLIIRKCLKSLVKKKKRIWEDNSCSQRKVNVYDQVKVPRI